MSVDRTDRGFSLLELMGVVGIIALLAGLSYPYLLQSTIATNEKATIATIRAIFRAQMQYSTRNPTYGSLADLVAQKLLDESMQGRLKAGYQYSTQNISSDHFEIVAVPATVGSSGIKGFFIDETSIVRYSSDGSSPNSASPPVQ